MRWPVDINQYPITQKFGENPDMYKKFGLLGHNGIDIGCPTGTKILAPISGKVIEATNDPSGYGLYIKIENNFEGSVLAHNQNFLVKVGDIVSEGQEIAISNNTGNSTGDHCHWGYYKFPRDRSNGYAGFIDQLGLISAIQPQPLAQTDQTKIQASLLNSADYPVSQDMEIQALRGILGDYGRYMKSHPDNPPTPPVSPANVPNPSPTTPNGLWAFLRAIFTNSK